MAALDPVGEQLECTSDMQLTRSDDATTVLATQKFPFVVAGGYLRGGPMLRVK